MVADSAKTCTFTISWPEVALNGGENSLLSWYFDGTTVVVTGYAVQGQNVTLTLSGNSQSASGTVWGENAVSSVTLNGVEYPMDVTGIVVLDTTSDVGIGDTTATVPEELPGLEEQDQAQLEEAANDAANKLTNVLQSIAAGVKTFIESLTENQEPSHYYLKVFESLYVVGYVPGESYTVDIEPHYRLYQVEEEGQEPSEGQEALHSGVLESDLLRAPVQVSLAVPAGLMLNENTYILHEDGTYIKPDNFDANAHTLTFTTPHFSQFTVVNDTRKATIDFTSEEGTVTCIYTPAEIGKELPKSEYGWTIHGKRYTTFEEELFQLGESALRAEPSDPPVNPGGGGGTPSEPEEPT